MASNINYFSILMKAKVKNFEVVAEPMTKWDYNSNIRKVQLQYSGNKAIDGYYCSWNGYKFWIDKDNFDKIYEIIEC